MTALRKRMTDDMISAGMAANTRIAYLHAVRGLAAYYRRSPDDLSEAEVRSYLLHVRDERGVAQGTFLPIHAAIQFLYVRTLDREWALFFKKECARRRRSACPTFSPTPRRAPSSAACAIPWPAALSC